MSHSDNPFQAPDTIFEHQYPINEGDDSILATRLKRLGAAILDMIIIGVVLFPPVFLYIYNNMETFVDRVNENPDAFQIGTALLGIVTYIVLNGSLLHSSGQTIGKRLVGIRVVCYDGSRASFGRLLGVRYLLITLIGWVPLIGHVFGLLNVLFIFGPERRCIHDFMADTKVVSA